MITIIHYTMTKKYSTKNNKQHNAGKKAKNDKVKAKKELDEIIEITERQNRALKKILKKNK